MLWRALFARWRADFSDALPCPTPEFIKPKLRALRRRSCKLKEQGALRRGGAVLGAERPRLLRHAVQHHRRPRHHSDAGLPSEREKRERGRGRALSNPSRRGGDEEAAT